jgi:hypothetical protein
MNFKIGTLGNDMSPMPFRKVRRRSMLSLATFMLSSSWQTAVSWTDFYLHRTALSYQSILTISVTILCSH